MDADDINADDLADFVEKQSKIEKESSKNLAAFVEEEKFADGKFEWIQVTIFNMQMSMEPEKRRKRWDELPEGEIIANF